ncbi:MAG: aminoacyl-tRNA hydrolase [Candidatus Saccharibacteria bacterium]
MGLFAKQPIRLSQDVPYTISLASKTKLIIGLGNFGKEYTKTRHNSGFMALDIFASDNSYDSWGNSKRFKGDICEKIVGNSRIILLKPTTFMNLSGESAQAIAHFYDIKIDNIVSVYDELSIPFGQIRSRTGGQSAGHNGVKSLINHLGSDFGRIRIGIKNDISAKAESSDFVLGKFNSDEQQLLPKVMHEVAGILTEFIYGNSLPTDTRKIFID